MSASVFIQCDWMNVEGRLTAFFSEDPRLQERLDAELSGGPKTHSIHAALIYGPTHGVTPETAKSTYVILQGQEVQAYDGGKRITHLWNYGGKARKIAEQYWLPIEEATRIERALAAEYPKVVAWRENLADTVFGKAAYACPKCGARGITADICVTCAALFNVRVQMRFVEWAIEPAHEMRTPFNRRRLYYGRRGESINALTSQCPQSSGASMWYRTLMRLHGFDVETGGRVTPWPVPYGALTWRPGMSYLRLLTRTPISVVTGTYDSFLIETPADRADEVIAWALWTMEQPWPQLGGRRFPAEPSIGKDWGKFDDRCASCREARDVCSCGSYSPRHANGLKDLKYRPLTATAPASLILAA